MAYAAYDVQKADTGLGTGVLEHFQTNVTNVINGYGKWATDGYNPFYSNYPLGGYYLYSDSWGGYTPLKAGQAVTSAPDTGSLPSAAIVLSELTMALRNASVALSNARQLHLTKYYYDQYYNAVLWADFGVALAHMTDNFRMGDPGGGIAGGDVTAAGVNAFSTTLWNVLSAHRASTVGFVEYWCHSACHSNHSSRNRR